jgi:hypothetical protein
VHTQTTINNDFITTSDGAYINYTKPSAAHYDAGSDITWTNTINSSRTGITVDTTVANSTTGTNTGTNKTVLTDDNETRPYNFGINWIIKT